MLQQGLWVAAITCLSLHDCSGLGSVCLLHLIYCFTSVTRKLSDVTEDRVRTRFPTAAEHSVYDEAHEPLHDE